MRFAILTALLLVPAAAGADTTTDVSKAFTAFVDGVVGKQPVPASVDTFITPFLDPQPVPQELGSLRSLIGAPKLKVTKVVPSKSGTSAWLVADVPIKAGVMRASAFLVHGDDGWHVTATHWSMSAPNTVVETCGAIMNDWKVPSAVPKNLVAPVTAIFNALDASDGTAFVKLLSDDKNALAIGSAPDEELSGGSIKTIFKHWKLGLNFWNHDADELPARAGMGPDGDLMWVALAVAAPSQLCTTYRALLVLQKEKTGWRIVHHHYSEPTDSRR